MIRIRVKGNSDHVEGFLIWGHAGSAPRGNDVVCAAVSAVATAALIGLTKRLPGSVRYSILPQGLIFCRLTDELPGDKIGEAQAILAAMVLGLDAIRRDHSEFINFSYWR